MLISFDRAAFARPGASASPTLGAPASATLLDITWGLEEGQTWAVVGPTGSGKTTFVEAIQGRLRRLSGEADWPIVRQAREADPRVSTPADIVARVSFHDSSRAFSPANHYYQQRFNFIDPEDDRTLRQYLASVGPPGEEVDRLAGKLWLMPLMDLSLIKLSTGQMRRARLARALLGKPQILILDDALIGLDVQVRAELVELLGELVADGLRLILVTRPEAIPDWVTHVAEVRDGRLSFQGARSDYRPAVETPTRVEVGEPPVIGPVIVELEDVEVQYGGKAILSGVTWQIREGERWALTGPNGSGKTTLLSVICGDHPQAYAQKVTMFGRRRGTGESIWEVRRPIGLVSPELHFYFSEPLTVLETVGTGLFDVMVRKPLDDAQTTLIRERLTAAGLGEMADRRFRTLSMGQQRLTLLVRAMVKDPRLLILDEPFQGLDTQTIARMMAHLEAALRPTQTLILVTHDDAEIPPSVTKRLRLREGRMA